MKTAFFFFLIQIRAAAWQRRQRKNCYKDLSGVRKSKTKQNTMKSSYRIPLNVASFILEGRFV